MYFFIQYAYSNRQQYQRVVDDGVHKTAVADQGDIGNLLLHLEFEVEKHPLDIDMYNCNNQELLLMQVVLCRMLVVEVQVANVK